MYEELTAASQVEQSSLQHVKAWLLVLDGQNPEAANGTM